MKKGHQHIKRKSKEDSILLAKVLCHKALITKKFVADYQQQIFDVAKGKETFSLETYKGLKRQLTSVRNLVRTSLPLGNKQLRALRQEPRIALFRLFEHGSNETNTKVLDRFRRREKYNVDLPLFELGNDVARDDDAGEQERASMEFCISIFLQETTL